MSVRPMRVHLRRTKDWRIPPDTVSVARPTRWGNPYRVILHEMVHTGDFDDKDEAIMQGPWLCQLQPGKDAGWWFASKTEASQKAVDLYRWKITQSPDPFWIALRERAIADLRWKNLACWCPHDMPCHADVLLELANQRMKP